MASQSLVYTFRTVKDLERFGDHVFVFKRLKEDLKTFQELILQTKPNYILGIGNASFTRYEARAVNKFHGRKLIKDAPDHYDLFTPDVADNQKSTDSFCNWTAFRLTHFIHENDLPIKLSFLHVEPSVRRDHYLDFSK